ncbi:MAG: DMT family transporter [Bryobacterales bacterium]
MTEVARRPITAGVVLTAVGLSAMWGGNVVGIKITLETLPPVWCAFWRMLIGLPTLWIWARVGGVDLMPKPGEGRPLLLLGGIFGFQIMLLNWSVQLTSAAYSAVLVNAAPILTNVIAHFFVADDRLSKLRVLGLALAFGGVSAVLLGKPDERLATAPLLGNALALATALAIASRMVYTQRLVQGINSTRTIFWQVVFALPLFLIVALLTEEPLAGPITVRTAAAMAYCSFGVVGIAFIVWVRLLEKYPPGLLSVFVFPMPLFGVLFSALIFRESISPSLAAGVALVAIGILIVTLEKRVRA